MSRGPRRRRSSRRGLAALEVVIATAIAAPAAAFLFYMGIRGCRNLFHAIGTLVGWPYL